MEQYFIANGVPQDSEESHKRRATLISVIGAKPDDVLSDFCSPSSPSEKTFDQLSAILINHFVPNFCQRYRFHNCTQRESESVSTFATNLKHLATTYQFGPHLDEALRNQFVCGLRSKDIQKNLLTEEHNFEQALKNALSYEAAEKHIAAFTHDNSTPVNKLGPGRQRHPHRHRQRNPSDKGQGKSDYKHKTDHPATECMSCGKPGHLRSSCKYRQYTCRNYGKVNHIKARSQGHRRTAPHPNQQTPSLSHCTTFPLGKR